MWLKNGNIGNAQLKEEYVCIQGDKVWVYPPEKKEKGYPTLLQDEFPGIPSPLDAAVECHRGECQEEGILFFQGQSSLESKASVMVGWYWWSSDTANGGGVESL